jgi:hypothetical protein
MFHNNSKKSTGGTGAGPGRKSKDSNNERHLLESLRFWDVVMPPVRKYMVGGYLVPGVKNAFSEISLGSLNKKRRITLELYRRVDLNNRSSNRIENRRVHKELLQGFPPSNTTATSTTATTTTATNSSMPDLYLHNDDMIIFRILKPVSAGAINRSHDDDQDDDDQSVATMQGDLEAHYLTTFSVDDYGDGHDDSNTKVRWRERHRAKLQTMEILNRHSRTVEIQMGVGEDTVVRDFSFESIQQADNFVKVFDELRRLQRERGMRQAAAHGSESSSPRSVPVDSGGAVVKSRGGLDLFSEDDEENGIPVDASPPLTAVVEGDDDGCCKGSPCRKQKKSFPNHLNLLVEICSASNLPIAGE